MEIDKRETRTPEQIREHYEVEKELADRLRAASRQERRTLYSELYDELFQRLPHHPQHDIKAREQEERSTALWYAGLMTDLVSADTVYLELGPGDCYLAFEMCRRVRKVYGVDVSAEITQSPHTPDNFELILSDGSSVPVADGSVDLVMSTQLMEHLHPDDALVQLAEIYRCLKPGGAYFCITPNRLYGPCDISRHFDDVATGFHMKEYTGGELKQLLRTAGFGRIRRYVTAQGRRIGVPSTPVYALESILAALPRRLSDSIARSDLIHKILWNNVIAWKGRG